MAENSTPYLNASGLAERLGKTNGYVSAMRAGGYQFLYGTSTTEKHARTWIKQTKFTPTAYFRAVRLKAAARKSLVAQGLPAAA